MKKILICLLICGLIVTCVPFSSFAVNSEIYHWYCARNKEHKQPTLDPNFQFIKEYGGYYVDLSHSDATEEKVLYLTFDAGYENGNIEKILNILKEENTTGAFFILENLILRNPELVKRMSEEGHIVANHTSKHKDVTKLQTIEEFKQELSSLETLYKNLTGKEMSKFFRPPEGTFSRTSLQYANELGYSTIFWSLAYADWDNKNQPSTEYANEKLRSNLHNGAIILLHPTSNTNAKILKDFIQECKAQGFRFASLEELICTAQEQ